MRGNAPLRGVDNTINDGNCWGVDQKYRRLCSRPKMLPIEKSKSPLALQNIKSDVGRINDIIAYSWLFIHLMQLFSIWGEKFTNFCCTNFSNRNLNSHNILLTTNNIQKSFFFIQFQRKQKHFWSSAMPFMHDLWIKYSALLTKNLKK